MAKKRSKKSSTKKSSTKKRKQTVARTRTGVLVDAVTLRAAKVKAAAEGRNVAEVLGDFAAMGGAAF